MWHVTCTQVNQGESRLLMVENEVDSLTPNLFFDNMKCDSRASFLARTFTNPCFGHEPKTKVTTTLDLLSIPRV